MLRDNLHLDQRYLTVIKPVNSDLSPQVIKHGSADGLYWTDVSGIAKIEIRAEVSVKRVQNCFNPFHCQI